MGNSEGWHNEETVEPLVQRNNRTQVHPEIHILTVLFPITTPLLLLLHYSQALSFDRLISHSLLTHTQSLMPLVSFYRIL